MIYDLIIVGGGIAGSTLGSRLSQQGLKVLILERESQFKDRVRGETILPWGVAAAQRLEILKVLEAAGGHHAPWQITYFNGDPVEKRDLRNTTPFPPFGCLNIYHPDMQEALLDHAIQCGAEVKREANVTTVERTQNHSVEVTFSENGKSHSEKTRLVVGADGRHSNVRSWAGFRVQQNPDILTVAGILFEGCRAPEDAIHLVIGSGFALLIAPQGGERARTYCVYPSVLDWQFSGKKKILEFLQRCREVGLPEEWFADIKVIGPLAEFPGADHWVESPARDGIVLIGDAAAASDPSWGCGLSKTLLDVECLSKHLMSTQDWSIALNHYAKEHDIYSSALRRILDWMTELVYTSGEAAQARRDRVFPRLLSNPTGFPDHAGQGPFGPSDEKARRLILGLDS